MYSCFLTPTNLEEAQRLFLAAPPGREQAPQFTYRAAPSDLLVAGELAATQVDTSVLKEAEAILKQVVKLGGEHEAEGGGEASDANVPERAPQQRDEPPSDHLLPRVVGPRA